MDKFLSGIRALFDQPSRPTGTRVDPISIARRAPELIKRLLDGSPIDGEELTRLTKNLTPAQKRSVKGNTDSCRRYFRLARRARIVPAAVGMGGGVTTGLGAATLTYPMVRKFLPGVAEADSLRQEQDDLLQLQRIIQGPSVLTEAAEEFTDRRQRPVRPKQRGSYRESADEIRAAMGDMRRAREEDFQRTVRATQGAIQPVAPSSLQVDRRDMGDTSFPATSGVDSVRVVDSLRVMDPSIPEMRVSNAFDALADADSIRGARRDKRRQEAASQRRTEGVPFMSAANSGPSATQNLIASAIEGLDEDVLPLSMRRIGEMGRTSLDAIRAAAQEQGESPDVSLSLTAEAGDLPSLLSPELDMSIDSGSPFGLPDDLSDLVEIIAQEETESPADQLKKIISTLELSGPSLRQSSLDSFNAPVPTDTIRVPKITSQRQSSAMRADRAKPRRRLQPTAPGIFGELLDESITDFQGAPMMSEREILRMIRGE